MLPGQSAELIAAKGSRNRVLGLGSRFGGGSGFRVEHQFQKVGCNDLGLWCTA